jgi:hypothetical protein
LADSYDRNISAVRRATRDGRLRFDALGFG